MIRMDMKVIWAVFEIFLKIGKLKISKNKISPKSTFQHKFMFGAFYCQFWIRQWLEWMWKSSGLFLKYFWKLESWKFQKTRFSPKSTFQHKFMFGAFSCQFWIRQWLGWIWKSSGLFLNFFWKLESWKFQKTRLEIEGAGFIVSQGWNTTTNTYVMLGLIFLENRTRTLIWRTALHASGYSLNPA